MAVSVGLVGAGPWAKAFHAPMLAAGPETTLAAVWARRPEAAGELAAAHGARPAGSFDALLDACEAVVFSVPPDVQAEYAPRAAAAGKALLLEKPLGLTLDQAQRVADAVAAAGVVSQLMLTYRYTARVREFLATTAQRAPVGAIATYVAGGARPGAYFATPWRIEHGALLDLGPHVLDLLDAAVGPIAEVRGTGDPTRWFALTARHENGVLSQAALSLTTPVPDQVFTVSVFTDAGELRLAELSGGTDDPGAPTTIRAEFAAAVVAGKSPELDAQRGLYLQRLIDAADRSARTAAG